MNDPVLPSDVLDRNRSVMETFYRLMLDRVHKLVARPAKWGIENSEPPDVDDILIFTLQDNAAPKDWKLARVVSVGVMEAQLLYEKSTTQDGQTTMGTTLRNFRDIAIIVRNSEANLNSKENFNFIKCCK